MHLEKRPESCVAFSNELNKAHDAFIMTNAFASETEIYKAINLVFHKARHIMQSAHELEGPRTAIITQMLPLWARNNTIEWPDQQLRLPLDLMPSFHFHGNALAGGNLEGQPFQTDFGVRHAGSSVSPAMITGTFSLTSGAEMDISPSSRKVNTGNPDLSSGTQLQTKNRSIKANIRLLSENTVIRPIHILPLPPSRKPGTFSLTSTANTQSMRLGPDPTSLTSNDVFQARGSPRSQAPSIRNWINSRAMKDFKRASVNNLFRQMGRAFREELHVDRSIPIYEHMFSQLKSAVTETANENCTDERAQKVLYNIMSQFRRHQKELWPANDLFRVQDREAVGTMNMVVKHVHSQRRTRHVAPQAPKLDAAQNPQTHTQQPVHQPVNQPLHNPVQDPIQDPIQQSTQQAGRHHLNHLKIASHYQLSTLSPAEMVAKYLREECGIPPSNVGTPTGYPEI